MRKSIVLAVSCTLYLTVCCGQPAWKFRSNNYLGLASGELGNYGLVQTVNGIYKGPWFLGLGAGLDNYRFRSIPLFFSVTRDLPVFGALPAFSKRGALFLNLDGGIDLPWYKRTVTGYDGIIASKFRPGPRWNAGLGYKWKLSAQTGKALLLSVAYSMKKLREDQTGPSTCVNSGICGITQQTYVYEYLNHTILFKIGFQF
jgi:hypothetical protein